MDYVDIFTIRGKAHTNELPNECSFPWLYKSKGEVCFQRTRKVLLVSGA